MNRGMNDLPEELRALLNETPREPMTAGDWAMVGAALGVGVIFWLAVAGAIVAWLL